MLDRMKDALDDDRRKWIMPVVTVVVLLIATYLVYRAWVTGGIVNEVALMCLDENCGYTRETQLQVGETLPLKCPNCGGDGHHNEKPCQLERG